MTRYTVVWHPLAEKELAELWLEAPSRAALGIAADQIDQELSTEADLKGLVVSARSREISVAPLHVLFRVKTEDRLVEVFSATLIQ